MAEVWKLLCVINTVAIVVLTALMVAVVGIVKDLSIVEKLARKIHKGKIEKGKSYDDRSSQAL